jgi:cation transport regulator ChaC
MAYEISAENKTAVMSHLNFREKCGYDKCFTKFYPKEGEALEPMILCFYISTAGNVWFVGEEDIATISKQIVECAGPSGTNLDYLLNLANSMRSIAPEEDDPHLFQLETTVLNLLKQNHTPPPS